MLEAENPLISIVLLCFNHEKFVAQALDGVLRQTYSPLDIVIVDDNSSDATANIIAATLAEHPDRSDVRFIHNPRNMQWRAAMDVGLQTVRGAFIVISCGDDIMLPEMVAEMAAIWRSEKVSLVTANAYHIDEQSNSLGRTHRDGNAVADDSFETLARDGANACCFGAAMGFERNLYETFGLPPSHLGAFVAVLCIPAEGRTLSAQTSPEISRSCPEFIAEPDRRKIAGIGARTARQRAHLRRPPCSFGSHAGRTRPAERHHAGAFCGVGAQNCPTAEYSNRGNGEETRQNSD